MLPILHLECAFQVQKIRVFSISSADAQMQWFCDTGLGKLMIKLIVGSFWF